MRRDWTAWAIEQLAAADFILVVASTDYRRRTEGEAPADEGRGARFEGAVIRNNLMRDLPAETARVLPVVLPGRNVDEIPAFLHAFSTSHYPVSSFTLTGATELLATLSGVARHPMPARGRFVGIPSPARSAVSRRTTGHEAAVFDQVCANLAHAVRGQWRAEERVRRLQDPVPIQTRWESVERPELQDHWVNVGFAPGESLGAGRLGEIADVFERVPSRRMVVLGEPGAGKTVLAMRLTLDLVTRRDPGAPVPVLFPVASWDPSRDTLPDWLVTRLIADYPGLGTASGRGKTVAHRMVEAGRVLPVLDGLDEMPTASRGVAVRRINAGLHHGDPLVVTCRADEYAVAVAEADVITSAAVISLRPLGIDDLADYLPRTARVSPGPEIEGKWDPVITFLRRPGHTRARDLLSVLGVPLMTSLARAAYSDTSADPAELVRDERFADPAAVMDHLVDQIVPAAYDEIVAQRGRQRWTADQVNRWFAALAAHDDDRVAWWRLERSVPRTLLALVGVVVGAACAGVPIGMMGGTGLGLLAGAVGGVASGVVSWTLSPTPSTVRLRFRGVLGARRQPRKTVPLGWPVAAALLVLALWIAAGPLGVLLAVVTVGIAFGLDAWFDAPAETSRVASPGWLLRADRAAALSRGVARGGVIGIANGLIKGPAVGVAFGLAAIVVSTAYTSWGRFTVARIWLAFSGRFPLRSMSFLSDAHRRGVLRQSGGAYEFRHAILRDRLRTKRGEPG
jgi:hypothetical protein